MLYLTDSDPMELNMAISAVQNAVKQVMEAISLAFCEVTWYQHYTYSYHSVYLPFCTCKKRSVCFVSFLTQQSNWYSDTVINYHTLKFEHAFRSYVLIINLQHPQEYWLLLHNVSYCMPLLEEIPLLLMTTSGKLSEETTFRLWISSSADHRLPTRLLHCCTKVVVDSPLVRD